MIPLTSASSSSLGVGPRAGHPGPLASWPPQRTSAYPPYLTTEFYEFEKSPTGHNLSIRGAYRLSTLVHVAILSGGGVFILYISMGQVGSSGRDGERYADSSIPSSTRESYEPCDVETRTPVPLRKRSDSVHQASLRHPEAMKDYEYMNMRCTLLDSGMKFMIHAQVPRAPHRRNIRLSIWSPAPWIAFLRLPPSTGSGLVHPSGPSSA